MKDVNTNPLKPVPAASQALQAERVIFSWANVKEAWSGVSKADVARVVVLIVSLYVASCMMFFGMNFWLWSFTAGLKRSYTSILVPSLLWAAMFPLALASCIVFQRCFRHNNFHSALFWTSDSEGIALLFAIGVFDSLTGLCGMYAAVHVPVILQTALISTGPVWTFFIARALYPASQRPFSPVLLLVFVCTAAGVAFALVPQVLDSKKIEFANPAWIVIFLGATALFPLYNVLQGRFLAKYADVTDGMTCRFTMLSVETIIQLIVTLLYFPLDSAPWFGKCASLGESWDMLQKSVHCIFTCESNAKYLIIYVLGFWTRHVVFAHLNRFSPTIAAITSQLTQPINAFFILVIPSWNVFGAAADWRFTLGSFLMMITSMTVYAFWHFSSTPRRVELDETSPNTSLQTLLLAHGHDEEELPLASIPKNK